MIGTPRARDALSLPLDRSPTRRGIGAQPFATAALLLILMAWPASSRAFLPGALSATEAERWTAAGMAGVPAARALRLPADPAAPATPWHLLAVLVDFPDRAGDRSAGGPSAWHQALFGAAPKRSLADYYRENSYGRLVIDGETTPWFRADHPSAWYLSDGAGNRGGGVDPDAYPHNSQALVEEIVRKLGAGYDWARYDNNGDGLVDGLLVVAAGPGADEAAPLDLPANRVKLLAHQFHTTMEVALPGARVFDYAIVAADAPLGVVAHEVGHLFGLIDLYQAGGFAGVDGPFGLGDWSLMATGALLGDGATPCHLDAWSKARLGFVQPRNLSAGSPQEMALPAAADSAAALQLGRGAEPGEYFLAEARFRRGYDAALPGEGLLVYHVSESVQTNSSSARYKVALVQADGRDDLGSRPGNRGDAGDPYPSVPSGNARLDDQSVPSSRNHDDSDSGARLAAIRSEGAGVRFTATLVQDVQPRVARAGLRETSGDGDGILRAGETGAIDLLVANDGARAAHDDLELGFDAPDDPLIALLTSALSLGNLATGEKRALPGALSFRVTAGFPAEGRAVRFPLRFTSSASAGGGQTSVPDTLTLFVGPSPAYGDDFESDAAGWTHATLRSTSADRWHVATVAAHSPTRAWFMGRDNGAVYDPALDDALVSPPLVVPPAGRLVFWQKVEAETLSSTRAWDGGRVEIAGHDARWTALDPLDGYPFRIETGSGNPLFGARAFSGRRDWQRVVCDLSPWAGTSVRLRFRFASDFFGAAPAGVTHSGWFIDDVGVAGGEAAPALLAASETPGTVRLSWSEPIASNAVRWIVTRRRAVEGAVPRPVADLAAQAGASFERIDAPPPDDYVYTLARVGPDGPEALSSSAPVTVGLPGDVVTLAPPYPNPYRPTGPRLNFEIDVPSMASAPAGALEIVDVVGRLVSRLPFTAAAGERQRLQWDGRTARGPLRAGVYFVRLRLDRRGGGTSYGVVHRLVVVN